MARSNRLLIAGGAVTLLGIGLALVVALGQGPAPEPSEVASPPTATASGTSGATVTPAVQIDEDGEPIFDVPEGMEAVAVTLEFQRSVAGLVAPGDRVNVFGVFSSTEVDITDGVPAVRRILADVTVLSVTGAEHASNGGSPTVVLALEPDEVETVIWTQTAESLYLSLVDEDTDESPATGGVDAGDLVP